MEVRIEESWKSVLQPEFDKPYFSILAGFVRKEYQSGIIYPPAGKIFEAFNLCPFSAVKVVILGQDPYHQPGQAHGLCFSVPDGVPAPPSLVNIFKEIAADMQDSTPKSTNLERWAHQGVLLLNTTLTVRQSTPMSHSGKGWEEFTDKVIEKVAQEKEGVVFMLWGSHAQTKAKLIDAKRHLVLKAVHPSPLSAYRGFFGCRHFSQANAYLMAKGDTPIMW